MNWITDRQPTREDADSSEDVWVSRGGRVHAARYWSKTAQDLCDAWMPKAPLPEPYVPPEPKRRHMTGGDGTKWISVIPGDPPDLDALLEAVDSIVNGRYSYKNGDDKLCDSMDHWVLDSDEMKKLVAARHGKWGE